MSVYPPVPSVDEVARHYTGAVRQAVRHEVPYRFWRLKDVLPLDICAGLLSLPIVPPYFGPNTDGTRGSYNDKRTFLTPAMQAMFPTCAAMANALQRPDVAKLMAETCGFKAAGSHLRMEYMQDIDGMWLEPHHDIPEKLFSMVIYLCTGPNAKDWGTDIYDADKKWWGRSEAEFNSASIFIPGENTWHGFEKRPIIGIRRLMEINYVRDDWRSRDQLCFPDRPIVLE